MKRLLVLLLAVLMIASILTGCFGDVNDPTEPTAPSDPLIPSAPTTPTTPTTPSGGDTTTPSDPTGSTTLTRADLQAAVAELAWDYYVKGSWVQYDSMDLNSRTDGLSEPLSRWMGGHTRLEHFGFAGLEDSTEQDTLYSVCSDFVWKVYHEALGYPILGSALNASTWYMWQYGEKPADMMVVRWHNWKEGTNSTETEDGFVSHDKCLAYDELFKFMENWEENLQAGDIIVWPGHAMLYVGNGYVIDCNGGKYNMKTGTDSVESSGAIRANTMYDLFFDPEMANGEYLSYFYMENLMRRTTSGQFCILRPLNLLTVDDGDGDPSNDVLNTEYELDTGLQKLQFPFDPSTVQTRDFTITAPTYSRIKYPLMNINRTVNITPYGTAIKGDEITYTIEITNGTNNESYGAWKRAGGDNWPFQVYKNLVVTEVVPENTQLVSARGATIEGNTLRWEFNLVAGQTKKLSYTVKVTGDIGDKIVNGGGWVDKIPSNTITNVIGGNKLSSKTASNMWKFFLAGVDAWNSNDGYKISAARDAGTRFAEQIYNMTAGLDLQLPEIQELMDMLFTQTLIEVESGQGGYFNHSVSRYMYTLNDETTDPGNQIYRDMVVDTFYGGVWAFSNPYTETPRTVDIRPENLQPGDILVMANLEASESRGMEEEDRDVKKWKILVYLGGTNFAELTSEGRMAAKNSALAITPIYTYDLFVVLRPSQAYADINTDVPAFVGPAKDLTDADKVYTYEMNVSDILLNDELAAQLAALTVDGCKQQNGVFIGEIYLKLKIDVVYNGTNDASFATFLKNVFQDVPSNSAAYSEFGHEYHLLSEPVENYEKLYEMLTYYGGPAFATKNEIKSLNDLHPGDAIMIGLRAQRYYTVAIYQGNGKFLGHTQALSGTIFKEAYTYYPLSFANDEEFLAWLSGPIQPELYPNVVYEGYVVLRPSRAFEDINAMQLRDITSGELTQDEMDRLAAITPEDRQKVTWHIYETAPWMYKMAYIDISPYLNKTAYRTMEQIFTWKNDMWVLPEKSTGPMYRAMLVDGYYGGLAFATSKTFKPEDFKIGDLFVAYRPEENNPSNNLYYHALYQGDGKFLMSLTNGDLYVDRKTVFADTLPTDFTAYYVLRPDQLANYEAPDPNEKPVLTNKLTDAQKDAIAAVQPDAIKNKVWTVNQVAPFVYNIAGVDLSAYFGAHPVTGKTLTNFWIGETLFKWENDVRVVRPATDGEYLQDCNYMLVDGYYGGTEFATSKTFTAADFEIGDIFVAYMPSVEETDAESKKVYYTAIYQGDGVFLAADERAGTSADNYAYVYVHDSETVFDANIGTAFTMYYVLRPGYVIPEQTEVKFELTEAQKDAIAAIAPETIKDKVWLTNDFAPKVYSAAGLNISEYFSTNPVTGKSMTNFWIGEALFKWSGGKRAIRPTDDAEYVSFISDMLVADYYGGSEFNESKTFTAADFEIGDLFVAYMTNPTNTAKNVYYTAVYQGNGVFLASDQSSGSYVYHQDSETVFGADIGTTFKMYYVLRPSNVIKESNVIEDTKPNFNLTEEQKAAIAAIKPEDIKNKVWLVESFAPKVYQAAGIDLKTGYFDTPAPANTSKLLTNYWMCETLFGWSDGLRVLRTSGDANYIAWADQMLVDGYYGGTHFAESKTFTAADFEIGDLFVGYLPAVDNASKNVYYTAVYQGNGVFLAADQSAGTSADGYAYVYAHDSETVFAEDIGATFAVYYVLRPSQLSE